MRNVILTIVSLLVLSASNANAQSKSNESKPNDSFRYAMEVYEKYLVPEDRNNFEKWIGGMQLGLLWANVMLKSRGQPLLYCQPDHLTITDSQMLDMRRRAMKDNPKWGDFSCRDDGFGNPSTDVSMQMMSGGAPLIWGQGTRSHWCRYFAYVGSRWTPT